MLLAGELPRDWPDEGTIDIGIHDSPHHSARTEWWYLNGHALLDGHPPVSFFAAFFISAADPNDRWDDKVHAVTWAITDAATSTYHSECRVDDRAPQLGLRQINDGHGMRDELFNRAMAEILEAGNVPRPDRMIGGDVRVESDPLLLRFGRSTLRKRKDDLHLRVIDDASLNGCDIKVMPTKRPIRHGENGLVPGALDGEVFFYYFIPRCTLAGTVRLDGVSYAIDSGCAWYDHEFGGVLTAATDGSVLASSRMGENVAWNWVGIQLDNGCEVSAYEILAADTSQSIDRRLVFVERDGSTRSTTDVSFESGPQ